jgi:hypothetical protein
MTTAINAEHHDRAMQVVKATLTFASASQSATTTHSYYGYVSQVFIDHGGSAPSDNWDLVVTDEFGVDVINGLGANVQSGTDKHTYTQADLDNGMACSGLLTFSGTNGGTGSGTVEIYLYIARYQ